MLRRCGGAGAWSIVAARFDGYGADGRSGAIQICWPCFGSGEGRWTINAAIDEGVPAPVLTAALYERFSSRGDADYENRLLSAMRYQFGGHVEKKAA